MIERLPDWEGRLYRVIDESKKKPFEWGKHDCCCFSALCVEAVTGKNLIKPYIGIYKDKKSAVAVLRKLGAGSLFKTLEGFFGPAVTPSIARRGDLACLVKKDGSSVGVCLGEYSYFVGEDGVHQGLVAIPTLNCFGVFQI